MSDARESRGEPAATTDAAHREPSEPAREWQIRNGFGWYGPGWWRDDEEPVS